MPLFTLLVELYYEKSINKMSYMNEFIGITVTKNYSDFLNLVIKSNHDVFKKWYIVTQEDDLNTIKLIKQHNLRNIELCFYPLVPKYSRPNHVKMPFVGNDALILYRGGPVKGVRKVICDDNLYKKRQEKNQNNDHIITTNNIKFDKGGAIKMIQQNKLVAGDKVLILDSDIILLNGLKCWLKTVKLKQQTLYGCFRRDFVSYKNLVYNEGTEYEANFLKNRLDGFFHLCVFDPQKTYHRSWSAADCDIHFKNQFINKVKVPLYCCHLGDARKNWKGRRSEVFK